MSYTSLSPAFILGLKRSGGGGGGGGGPPPAVPVNSALPGITGTAQEGQTLTIGTGAWTNSPGSYAITLSNGGTPTGSGPWTYVVPGALVGSTLTATVTASNAGGAAAPATSVATATVTAATAPWTDFELLNEAGSGTITSVPNLRVSIDSGATFYALGSVPGHTLTIARGVDTRSLVISGWAGGTVPAGLRVHYEQVSGEPNEAPSNTTANLPAVYFKRVAGPAPVNTTLPGTTVCATVSTASIGVS